ncbi:MULTISPECIES: hypothetical protein [Prevotellaceae]|uniref:hypothetical protein n=1 Tax=Prevotellaceae TaxID=171552 RepID=UPI0003D37767|nr:hypothetical protein [Prevotella phocaeensis]ETD21255.1 hypothetical protein HMPREF1199_00323 [Hoylesella oralis CC98A]
MNKKKTYIAPDIRVIHLAIEKGITQFVVAFHNTGEDESEAKQGVSDDEEWQVNNMQWNNR